MIYNFKTDKLPQLSQVGGKAKALIETTRAGFPVRSSSPEEDLENTSFAGMYETFLGVKKNDLEKAISKAFASAFDYRVMSYKKQNELSLEGTSIAVIVQRQISSHVSGLIGIMDLIQDGDLVEVDGDNGIVRIIEEKQSESLENTT